METGNSNGSRQAWGYLDPTDKVIVTNDGEVYVRVEKDQLEMKKDKPPTATFPRRFAVCFVVPSAG